MFMDLYQWIKRLLFYCSNNKKTKIERIEIELETNPYYDTLDTIKSETIISNNINSSVYLYNNYIYKVIHFKSTNYLDNYCNIIYQLDKDLNILYPIDMIEHKNHLIEIYQYLPNCDLFDFIVTYTLTQQDKYKIILSLMETISQLHNSGFAHRDIKPENIFYLPNNKILLIDLIMSAEYNDCKNFRGGSITYASPQMFQDIYLENDWRRTDIWSLGVVIYVIQCKIFPWTNSIDCDIYLSYKSIENKQKYWDNVINDKLISKLLFHSLAINPEERKDINQLIDIFKNELDISIP